MPFGSRLTIIVTIAFAATALSAAEPEGQVIVHTGGGFFTFQPAPGPAVDPAGTPSPALLERLTAGERIDQDLVRELVADLVDRCESTHRSAIEPAVEAWLARRPAIRRAFWLAVDPRYDDPAAAAGLLGRLIAHDAERCQRFAHLAIAMAVVHDQGDALRSSRLAMIWSVEPDQFPALPDPLELFDHFTAADSLRRMPYPPDQLVWPLLVHVVDLDLPAAERQWVVDRFENGHGDLARTYRMVPYDRGKLSGRPKLGKAPYLLANLLDHGGVCVDQAHFSTRVMKTFGVPAFKCSGESRYGGTGHAWTGFLAADRHAASLRFTGRYNHDYYYTGAVFDPQTRTTVLDRELAMTLDGALADYRGYVDAGALVRIAESLFATHPQTSLRLTEAALDRNLLRAEGWQLLTRHLEAGHLPPERGTAWLNTMARRLQHHPDLTMAVLTSALDSMPQDARERRGRLYDRIYELYRERPDLQVALRQRQCAELYDAGRDEEATTLAMQTLLANAKEGSLILPLVEVVVEDGRARPPEQRAAIRAMFEQVAEHFPKRRGHAPSPAYAEFRELVERL